LSELAIQNYLIAFSFIAFTKRCSFVSNYN